MYQHPKTLFWMVDQERERAMAQRALERAARDGHENPGLFKGGLSSLAKAVRGAVGATGLHFGDPRATTGLTGAGEA
jgi:hypothetical protein